MYWIGAQPTREEFTQLLICSGNLGEEIQQPGDHTLPRH